MMSFNHVDHYSRSQINKLISSFLAQNRARNDASNRTEFLHSVVQHRRRSREDSDNPLDIPSCARADAKPIDRDVQMKYDIAKNEDGPLRRTVRHQGTVASDSGVGTEAKGKKRKVKEREKWETERKAEPVEVAVNLTSDQHPGLNQRLVNIETHFSVRYGMFFFSFVLSLKDANCPSSAVPTPYPSRASEVPGRSYHQTRERLSTLGGIAL